MQHSIAWIGMIAMVSLTISLSAGEPTRVVFLGDSLTAGYGLTPDQAYPALLEQALRREGYEVTCINAGLSGDTTAGGVRRLDWLLRQPVDLLVVALGANDALRGFPVEHTEKNLQAIMDEVQARQPTARVLLLGMLAPPNLGVRYGNAFVGMYRSLATHPVVIGFMPFLLKGVAGVAAYNQADGIHPTAEGQRMIASEVLPYVKAALAPVRMDGP
ncbi:MAG: arylesterase [Verrucomicrobia bacterium]|nr:arylesterase [Verrucomicrobiota bacterium]